MMPSPKSATEQEISGRHADILIIIDTATLLSFHPDASLSADTPTHIDDAFIYVMNTRDGRLLGRNDGHFDLVATVDDAIHIRENAVALRGEHSVLFHDVKPVDADILSAPSLIV